MLAQKHSTQCAGHHRTRVVPLHRSTCRAGGRGPQHAGVQPHTRRVRVRTAQVTSAPTQQGDQPSQQASTAPGADGQVFNWTKHWYPVMCLDNADADKPNTFKLLGKDYLVWCDSKGAWHCFVDRCPHRLATLSDGFIDKKRDEVVCAYHGWRFESDGRCAVIPQALDETSRTTALASPRSCVTAFPVRSAGGLLWVWPDASPNAAAEADAAPLPLLPELLDDKVAPMEGRWFQRDMPYSCDVLWENLLDPTHVDYAHHGIAGYDATKAPKLDVQIVEDKGPAGFKFQTLPLDPTRRGIYGTFMPPNCVVLSPGADPTVAVTGKKSSAPGDVRPGSENPDVLTTLVFYGFPSRPGWTRFYGTSFVTDPAGQPVKSFSLFATAMPPWLKHVLGFEFFAGDDVFLGAVSKQYAVEGQDWKRSYYNPTRADVAILKLRQWLDTYAGGQLPFPKHMQGSEPILRNLDITRRQAMDRYTQHVQHCRECKAALARTRAVAIAAAVAAVASLVGACLCACVRASAALSPQAVPGWLGGLVSWGQPGVLGLAGPLLLLGFVAAGVHFAAKKLEGLFYFRDFVRPTFEAAPAGNS